MSDNLHYFSAKEYAFQKKAQSFRDRVLKSFVKILVLLRITPNIVTLMSFLCVISFSYFLIDVPYIALLFLLLHVVLDGVDGVLARLTNTSSRAGALLDVLNDHTGFVVVVGSLMYYGFVHPVMGLAYVYLYSLLVVLLVYCNTINITPKFTVRTKYFLYIIYAIWVIWRVAIFQQAIIVFIILTIPFVVEILFRVLSYLQKKN